MQQAQTIAKALPIVSLESQQKPKHVTGEAATSSKANPVALPDTLRRKLWVKLAEIYGHRWTSAYGDSESGAAQTWAKALRDLTALQIATGLRACVEGCDDWPPTLPRFRAMCLAIPSFSAVRSELLDRNGERSSFARLVWSKLDGYRFTRADSDAADRMLREAYGSACEHVMQGKPLPDDPAGEIAHEASEFKPASRETIESNLAAMAKALGLSESERQLFESSIDNLSPP